MSTTRYDRYGRPAGFYGNMSAEVEAYMVDKATASIQYICYYETGDNPRAIRRVYKANGITQICVGWGAWDDRDSIDYYPVNSVFTVDNETKALVSVSPYNTPVPPPDAE